MLIDGWVSRWQAEDLPTRKASILKDCSSVEVMGNWDWIWGVGSFKREKARHSPIRQWQNGFMTEAWQDSQAVLRIHLWFAFLKRRMRNRENKKVKKSKESHTIVPATRHLCPNLPRDVEHPPRRQPAGGRGATQPTSHGLPALA